MPRIEAIIPAKAMVDIKKLERNVKSTLLAAAKGAQVDFKVTTQTWDHKPDFAIRQQSEQVIVSTDDEIYGYVSGGTKPHDIAPKNKRRLAFQTQYRAKTSPRQIASSSGGSSGPFVLAKKVRHPGTKARDFDQVIADKWQKELPRIMDRAIDEAIP